MIPRLKNNIHPGLRGAFFYGSYWGAVGMFEPFLNIYFLNSGLSAIQIGWLAAVLPFCTMIINPFIARRADHTQRRVVFLAATCTGFGLALLAFSLASPGLSFLILLGFVTLVSVFRAPVSPLADSLAASMASRYLLDFGKMRLWGSITFTISAISLGAVWQLVGFQAMFAASAMLFIPTVFVALLLEEPKTDQVNLTTSRLEEPDPIATPNLVENHIPSVKIKTRSSTRLRLAPGLLFLLASTFFLLAGLFMTGTFSSVYLSQLGGSTALIGAVMGLAALGEVPGMLFCNRIARRIGDTNILIASYGIVAVGMFGYTISTAPTAQLVFAALRGIGFGSVLVATVTIINSRSPLNQASTYQGILSAACWGLAPLLGGPVGGRIYQTFGPLVFFYTATFMAVVAMLLISPTYWFWKKSSGEK